MEVASQLSKYLLDCFKCCHRTKTSLFQVNNDSKMSIDHSNAVVLIFIDLSAALLTVYTVPLHSDMEENITRMLCVSLDPGNKATFSFSSDN